MDSSIQESNSGYARTGAVILVYLAFSVATSLVFYHSDAAISDDQLTYYASALQFSIDSTEKASWSSSFTFSYFLYLVHLTGADAKACFTILYFIISFIYLLAMHWALGRYIENNTTRCLTVLISTTPFYVLGMTHWGFASFDLIRARILSTAFAPIILRLFLDNLRTRRIYAAYLLCGIVSFLSLEIAFLAPILFLAALFSFMSQPEDFWRHLLNHILGFVACVAIIALSAGSREILAHALGIESVSVTENVYQKMFSVYRPHLEALTQREYTDLLWAAAYKGFWWTMFPPQLKDVFFILLNGASFFFIIGIAFLVKAHRKLFRGYELLFLFISSFLVAYLFQIICVVSWKLFSTPPFIFEEVRSVKYALFPGFVLIGVFLEQLRTARKRTAMIAVALLLLVSPLNAARSLPQSWKLALAGLAEDLGVKAIDREYMLKALDYRDPNEEQELSQLIEILKPIAKEEPIVLSDIHQLKHAGVLTLVSYQDKRGKIIETLAFADRRDHRFAVWHLAYQDMQKALRSDDPEDILKVMNRFDVPIAVGYTRLQHPNLRTLYQGNTFTLYQLVR